MYDSYVMNLIDIYVMYGSYVLYVIDVYVMCYSYVTYIIAYAMYNVYVCLCNNCE